MSVVIVVKVSEGLVLGADSAASLFGRVEGPGGTREGIVQTYYNAKKVLQIGDFPIGVLTWGQAFIGPRTIESLVREWQHNNQWQAQESRKKFTVKACAQGLREHLAAAYVEEFGEAPENERPGLGAVVAGYSKGEFFPQVWRFILPPDLECDVHDQRPDQDGKPDFGASWFGLTEPIVRLHWGRDEAALKIMSERFGVKLEDLHQALMPLQYQVPFAVMPLQDAIEYANYMLNVVIGRYRFVVGPELCGGPIEIAAVTQSEFTWIRKKTWKL